jgi:uracil-DNA glycosylase family 4
MDDNWEQAGTLAEFWEAITDCPKCKLCKSRSQVVLGSGNEHADIMFVGEAPGVQEDRQGIPFVGPAGQFLDQLLRSIDLERADVYITNTVKCRPPDNRDPEPEEIKACNPYLRKQMGMIEPRIICTLGNYATKTLLDTSAGISQLHGKLIRKGSLSYVPLFHPAAALHKPPLRNVLIEDFERLREHLEGEKARWQQADSHVAESIATAPEVEQPEQMGLF